MAPGRHKFHPIILQCLLSLISAGNVAKGIMASAPGRGTKGKDIIKYEGGWRGEKHREHKNSKKQEPSDAKDAKEAGYLSVLRR